MKTITAYFKPLLLLLVMVFAISCSEDESDDPIMMDPETIVDVAKNRDALTSLVSALTAADDLEGTDLIETLNSDGPFTVFAPTNDAFTALLAQLDGFDSLDDFDTDEERAILAKILTYHVVAGTTAASTDLTDGMTVTTVQGEDLTISLEGGVFIDDATAINAEVIIPDVTASNGIVHVIDKVLLPQEIIDALNADEMEDENGTLVDIVVDTESLSILEAAVIKADLAGTLSSDGPFTVFAPTDDAFVALLDILGDDYNSLDDFDTMEEMALLKDILLYHVIAAEVKSTDLSAGAVPTALPDNSIEVIASGDTFVIGDASSNDANITGVDIMASNGVAHTIDKVLLPQSAIDFVMQLQMKTIVDTAVETDDLSLLVDALIQANAGLVETLNGDGPFTVFAPTNAAFAALLDTLGDDYNSLSDFDTDEEKDLLVTILTYHVVAGTAAFSTSLSDGQEIETFQGENVTVIIKDGTVHIGDATDENATVAMPDVEASNGVVHVIDKVLLPQAALDALEPPMPNIVEAAQATEDLSLLVEALIQADAGLVETLSGEGPFTVFAPTNSAFAALLDDLGDNYNSLEDFDTDEEKILLAKILTYHVVSGAAVASTDLSDHQEITTVQGESLFAILSHGVQIRDKTHVDANVTMPDVMTSNGIVHIIDKVLLPQEIIDALH